METRRFLLGTNKLKEAADFFVSEFEFNYRNEGTEMIVLLIDYSFLEIGPKQVNVIILKQTEKELMQIDFVSGAGQTSYIWDSEIAFVKKAEKKLLIFAEKEGVKAEEIPYR